MRKISVFLCVVMALMVGLCFSGCSQKMEEKTIGSMTFEVPENYSKNDANVSDKDDDRWGWHIENANYVATDDTSKYVIVYYEQWADDRDLEKMVADHEESGKNLGEGMTKTVLSKEKQKIGGCDAYLLHEQTETENSTMESYWAAIDGPDGFYLVTSNNTDVLDTIIFK